MFAPNLCSKCDKNEAQEPHICPFAQEIADDNESLCDCCDDCELNCAMDI